MPEKRQKEYNLFKIMQIQKQKQKSTYQHNLSIKFGELMNQIILIQRYDIRWVYN